MEPSETLYNQLKNNSLKNNTILNNYHSKQLVFDDLSNNLPDVFDQFFKPFRRLLTTMPGSHSSIYLIFLKLILKCLVLIQ